jgi:hypothetical protein
MKLRIEALPDHHLDAKRANRAVSHLRGWGFLFVFLTQR